MNTQHILPARDVTLDDWRWLLGSLHGRFDTGSFTVGARFLDDVAEVADELNHHPDVRLSYGHVRFTLRSHDVGGVTSRDVELATRISALAADRGLAPRPEILQVLELALDTPDAAAIGPFWAAALGAEESDGDVTDPAGELPLLWFQDTDSSAPDRQRFHLDVTVPAEAAEARIRAVEAAGGVVSDATHAPSFIVLADADGNKVCVCTELGRD